MAAQATAVPSVYSVNTVAFTPIANQQRRMEFGRRPVALLWAFGSKPWPKIVRDQVDIIGTMSLQDFSDEELIVRYRAEENRAESQPYVNELFQRHYVRVARWCLAFTSDRESAADLAQEIFAKVYQHLPTFKGQSRFSTWLFSIARNHCFNAVRSRVSAPAMDSADTIIDSLPDLASKSPDVALGRKQQVELARQLLNEALDERERLVFTLHFARGLPLDVITRMLNLSNASGAKAFVVSARRKLQRALKRQVKAKAGQEQ